MVFDIDFYYSYCCVENEEKGYLFCGYFGKFFIEIMKLWRKLVFCI